LAWNLHLRRVLKKKQQIENELNDYKSKLEEQVQTRTKQYLEAHDELLAANEEMSSTNEELIDTVKRFGRETILRLNVQTKLEENEELFRRFIEQSTDGICIINYQGHVILWNEKMYKITGLLAENVKNNF